MRVNSYNMGGMDLNLLSFNYPIVECEVQSPYFKVVEMLET